MEKTPCPDILTIQAVIDGEEKNKDLFVHLQNCSSCSKNYRVLQELVSTADGLGSEAKLPDGFYDSLTLGISTKPFRAGLMAAVMFVLVSLSAFFLAPGYIGWWLTSGITETVGLCIDFFIGLFIISRNLDPIWIIMAATALVVLEVLILNKLKAVEG